MASRDAWPVGSSMRPWKPRPATRLRLSVLAGREPGRPCPAAADRHGRADVVVIGGGFTGLWTAIALTDSAPRLQVVVIEAESVGFGRASQRGFCCGPA